MLRNAGLVLSALMMPFGVYAQTAGSDIWVVATSNVDDVSAWQQVTDAPYYHNQPYFSEDGRVLFYTGADETGQTDIYRYTIDNGQTINITQTATSEYSPTPEPSGEGLSGIWVDTNGKQWLRQWDWSGQPMRKVIEVDPIGYHVWLGENAVLVFVLGQEADPIHTLQRVTVGQSHGEIIDQNIGASLWQIPMTSERFSYSKRDGEQHVLMEYNAKTQAIRPLMDLPSDVQYYAWRNDQKVVLPDNQALRLSVRAPDDDSWIHWFSFERRCPNGVSRLAFSADGNYLALVCNRA